MRSERQLRPLRPDLCQGCPRVGTAGRQRRTAASLEQKLRRGGGRRRGEDGEAGDRRGEDGGDAGGPPPWQLASSARVAPAGEL
jgi:hypothetical protein